MMQFHYRNFDKEMDMPLLHKLLRLREEQEMSDIFLPPTGVIVFMEDLPVCIGFMVKCDNGMAINSDLVSDPTVPKELRSAAVQYMRELLYAKAKVAGLKVTTIFTKHAKLQNKLKDMGYVVVDSNLTQMGRAL